MFRWLGGPKWRRIWDWGFHGDENVDCGIHNLHGGYLDYQTTEDSNRTDSFYIKEADQRSSDLQFFAYAMIRSRNLAILSLGLAGRTKPHSQPLHTIIPFQKKDQSRMVWVSFHLWHNTVLGKSCSHMSQGPPTENIASCCTEISVCVPHC
jgi:hypothetical protein